MPRPFGVWHPATTIAELHARTPSWKDGRFQSMYKMRGETHYSPETMAWFKNPQAFKDHVDRIKEMRFSDKFFGQGFKYPRYHSTKVFGCVCFLTSINMSLTWYFYNRWVPARNPTWRKIVNKEWEEAINNSPWDHRSHVWTYSNVHAAHLGSVSTHGAKKFYIPS